MRVSWRSEAGAATGKALAKEVHAFLDGHGEAASNEFSELAVAFGFERVECFLPSGSAASFRGWLGLAHGANDLTTFGRFEKSATTFLSLSSSIKVLNQVGGAGCGSGSKVG